MKTTKIMPKAMTLGSFYEILVWDKVTKRFNELVPVLKKKDAIKEVEKHKAMGRHAMYVARSIWK